MFSKKPDEFVPESPRVDRLPTNGPIASNSAAESVIGSDVVIRGDIEASADLHIDGRIEGDIKCAKLVQGEGSTVEGAIEAESARVGGSISGSIAARELVVLRTARINGDVHYDALTIEQGAQVEGRFAHRMPAKASAPAQAPATPRAAPALNPDKGPDKGDDSEPKLTLAS